MTVQELINILKEYDPAGQVLYKTYDEGMSWIQPLEESQIDDYNGKDILFMAF